MNQSSKGCIRSGQGGGERGGGRVRREGEEGEGGEGRGGCSGRIAKKERYMWLLAHIVFVCMYVVVYFTIHVSTVWTRVY